MEFKDKLWRLSYNYLKRKPAICKIDNIPNGYLMTDKEHSDKIHQAQLFLKDIGCLNLNFNSAVGFIKKCFILYFNDQSWPLSTCTCNYFFKKNMCIHIVILAITLGYVEIPAKFRETYVGKKPMRGKKRKAMKALSCQYD